MPSLDSGPRSSVRRRAKVLALAAVLIGAPLAPAQMNPDQAAAVVLASARRAYNEKQYAFAAGRFREFLARFGGHREATAARYGLALCLVDGPDRDYAGAVEQLQQVVGHADFAEQPLALYYLGLAQRGLGMKELAQAAARPPEAAPHQEAARQRFEEAGRQFAAALPALAARAKPPPAGTRELPADQEWPARARCDLAEMQLRTRKAAEARTTAAPFLDDRLLARSRYRKLGLYYHGFACFLLHDYRTAGRSLNRLALFTDPLFGTHAHYLAARLHHLAGEREAAAQGYEAVRAEHTRQKQAAVQALQHPENFKNDPEEKARLKELTRNAPPEHVARALLYRAVLLYEDGRFAEALTRLEDLARRIPRSPLLADVRLREGFCQVQLRQFRKARQTLQPLVDRDPRLADQALLGIAKAQVGSADARNKPAYRQALQTAMDTLRRAADRAGQRVANEPEARARQGEIFQELALVQERANEHRQAAATWARVANERLLPGREDELLVRQATALHLAGDYQESDRLCQQFQQAYPRSSLLPAVLFRQAENAYFTAAATERNAHLPSNSPESVRLYGEAAGRYQILLDRFPRSAHANLARYGQAVALVHQGDVNKARKVLEVIPPADRKDNLAAVSYVLADCILRTAPAQDAADPAAGRLEKDCQRAGELLESFVAAQPNDPQAADALLKLGLCQQRLASQRQQPAERARCLGNARAAYEALLQRFPKHPLGPRAIFERARCLEQAGDPQHAREELQRFGNDPLRSTAVAPVALLELARLFRQEHRPTEAAKVLAQARQQHEGALGADPQRVRWVAVLRYQHGLALLEASQFAQARDLFDQVARQFPGRPEGFEAGLRWSQCRREEGLSKVEAARKAQAAARRPEELEAAGRLFDEGLGPIQEALRYLEGQAEQLRHQQPAAALRARALYELAWGYRLLGEAEMAAARGKIQLAQWRTLQDQARKDTPGSAEASVPVPDVPRQAIPLQPGEQKAREQYRALLAAYPGLPLADLARFELSELYAQRGEHTAAIKLLQEGLARKPPNALADKIRLRLGACYAERQEIRSAVAQFEAVARNPQGSLVAQAHYRAGDCLLRSGDAAGAVRHLALFRDQPPLQNQPGLSDPALLRLGRALAHLGQWDASRQAYETLLARFGASPWVHEARYGMGWAWQNQRQFDNAVAAYEQVVAATATETAARAQLQIGLCRLEQKRYPEAANALLIVPFTYDYPEWNAAALCEAARAYLELQQPIPAERLLERVLRDHPRSKWAQVAQERLATLRGS